METTTTTGGSRMRPRSRMHRLELKIHTHPKYWGIYLTRSDVRRSIAQMRQCARRAGFVLAGAVAAGTDESYLRIVRGALWTTSSEIDWFSRWCLNGFRGMTAWLRKQQ